MNEKSRNLVAGFSHENMWTDNKPILSTKYAPYCVDKHRMLKLFCGKGSKLVKNKRIYGNYQIILKRKKFL
jgi:hypothetical protein